jgi:hypothetical protein
LAEFDAETESEKGQGNLVLGQSHLIRCPSHRRHHRRLTAELKFSYMGDAQAAGATWVDGIHWTRDLEFTSSLGPASYASRFGVWMSDTTQGWGHASSSAGHLNTWEFHVADINGDGIDDYIEFYRGAMGDQTRYAMFTNLGPVYWDNNQWKRLPFGRSLDW